MKRFIGIGAMHWTERFDYIYSILEKEKPDLILLEYGFDNVMPFRTEHDRCKRIETRQAKVEFDLSRKNEPKVYLDEFLVFGRRAPSESRAGMSYGLNKGIPVFLADEPFIRAKGFSKKIQEKGIIGFENNNMPGYEIMITPHDREKHPDNTYNQLIQRNFFFKDALDVLEQIFRPGTVAGIGGLSHYYLTKYANSIRPGYGPEYTLSYLINAEKKIIYDSIRKRKIK